MIEIYWKKRQKSKFKICSEAVFADIETSHDEASGKTWMVSCQLKFAGTYKVVRTPSEFIDYLQDLIDRFALDESRKIYIYFHNASFDLSYLLPWVQMMLPGYETRKGIYDGRNRIITYMQGPFEFRCTYLLSSCSLERWGEEMNAEHRKKVGLYNYDKVLYQDSDLSKDEEAYDEYDVLCMEDSLRKQMEAYNDDLSSIPLTSTAYIRRILRNSCLNYPNYRSEVFLKSKMTAEAYDMTLQSYAGGYTHENRFVKSFTIYPGKINKLKRTTLDLRGCNIKHKDFRSHYPTQIRKYPMPWGKCEFYYSYEEKSKYLKYHDHEICIQDLLDLYPEYSTISMIRISDMRLKDRFCTMPFMQNSKMFNKSKGFRTLNDNGRALATKGSFTTYIDNLTLDIINKQYDFKYKILKVYRFENKQCPEPIKKVIDDLFKKKSDYKIEYQHCRDSYGEADQRTIDALFNLNQTKKLLNACYGCMSTAIIRSEDDLDFIRYYEQGDIEDPFISHMPKEESERMAKLEKFYNSRNSFLPYQVGVMVCASARHELFEYIETIGYENILYGDTDSLFYISNAEIEARVEALNAEKHKTAPYIEDSTGEKIYYDVFEDEPEVFAFRGLHSKCYAVITENKEGKKELVATVAGVPRRTIIGMDKDVPVYLTREEELAGITAELKLAGRDSYDPYKAIDNLKDGFSFHINTGFTAKYLRDKPGLYEVNGHMVETSGGCIITKLPEKLIVNNCPYEVNAKFSKAYIEGV